jgi:hypothetical protein
VTGATVEESPVRLHRDVEQKNLEELNGRLEQYIMKQRAKDASREAFEKDLANIQQQARLAIHANVTSFLFLESVFTFLL